MNIKNMKKLLAHLVRQQKSQKAARFNMKYWGTPCLGKNDGMSDVLKTPVCKTQACLAGETVLALNMGKIGQGGGIDLLPEFYGGIGQVAAQALELTPSQRESLFAFKSWGHQQFGWPKEFETAYNAAKTPAKRLGVAIQRVKHFIKTNGAE
jgi:hypothetical protein